MNRRLLFIIGLVIVLLLGLTGAYFYLLGGPQHAKRTSEKPPPAGIVPVKSIYVADDENLYRPVGIGASGGGEFAVTLRDSQKIILFDRQGRWIRTWGERGLQPGQLMAPLGVAFDKPSDHVYVTDRSRLRLITYSSQGRYLWEVPLLNPLTPVVGHDGVLVTTFGPLVQLTSQGQVQKEVGTRGSDLGQFDYPRGAAFHGDSLIVADSNNTRLQRVKVSGTTTATVEWYAGAPPKKQDDPDTLYGLPSGVALDDSGRAYVLDGFRHAIHVVDAESGKELHAFKELEGSTGGRFNLPTSIAYLGGNLFAITDTYNDRVQIVRILLPGEDHVVARYPWLLWFLPLLLLPFLLLFGRKKWYATAEAMELARDEERLRLLASVGGRIRVTPEVAERFGETLERDIAMGQYLAPVGEAGETATARERLLAAMPAGTGRLLLPRVRVVCATDEECSAMSGRGRVPIVLEALAQQYRLEGEPQEPAAHLVPSTETEVVGEAE